MEGRLTAMSSRLARKLLKRSRLLAEVAAGTAGQEAGTIEAETIADDHALVTDAVVRVVVKGVGVVPLGGAVHLGGVVPLAAEETGDVARPEEGAVEARPKRKNDLPLDLPRNQAHAPSLAAKVAQARDPAAAAAAAAQKVGRKNPFSLPGIGRFEITETRPDKTA